MRTKCLLFIGLALLSAACTSVPPQRTDQADRGERRVAFVRVVNALPDGALVDIYAGDKKIFAGVKPGALIPYHELARGVTTFRARWAGHDQDRAIAENVEVLGHKEYSTIVLRPDNGSSGIAMMVFDDHVWAPSTGKAKIRVVHAIPGMSDIDVYAQGKRVLGGVDFTDESRYAEVDPITGDLVLKRDDNQQTVATVAALRLEANKAYTILLAGNKDKPRTIVLEDRTEEQPPMPPAYPLS
jgi:hypothetical protein